MKDPNRDLPRVIFIGIPTVIMFYLFSNIAYLAVLPSKVVVHTNTVAMDFGKTLFGPAGGILFALCVALSCFGVRMCFGRGYDYRFTYSSIPYRRQTPQSLQVHGLSLCLQNKVIYQLSLAK